MQRRRRENTALSDPALAKAQATAVHSHSMPTTKQKQKANKKINSAKTIETIIVGVIFAMHFLQMQGYIIIATPKRTWQSQCTPAITDCSMCRSVAASTASAKTPVRTVDMRTLQKKGFNSGRAFHEHLMEVWRNAMRKQKEYNVGRLVSICTRRTCRDYDT